MPDHDKDDEIIRRQNMAVFIIFILLVVAGIFLALEVRKNAKLEECIEARQRNCEPLDLPEETAHDHP